MVGVFKRQRYAAFVANGKRFKRGYGMLSLYRAKNSTANVYYVR